jgi:hypothetical protein
MNGGGLGLDGLMVGDDLLGGLGGRRRVGDN